MFAPSERLASLDWIEIRRVYEEEGIAFARLAERFGIASPTTCKRRAIKEGWRKPGDTETSMDVIVAAGHPSVQQWPPQAEQADNEAEVIPVAEVIADQVLHHTAEDLIQGVPAGPVMSIHALAQLQSAEIREQLDIATEISDTGRKLMRAIRDLLDNDPDKPEATDKASRALARLIGVNADRETLAGLLKAGVDVIVRGTDIKRRALGMDVRRPGSPTPDLIAETAAAAPLDRPAVRLIRTLDADLASKLRERALAAVQEQRNRQIEAAGGSAA